MSHCMEVIQAHGCSMRPLDSLWLDWHSSSHSTTGIILHTCVGAENESFCNSCAFTARAWSIGLTVRNEWMNRLNRSMAAILWLWFFSSNHSRIIVFDNTTLFLFYSFGIVDEVIEARRSPFESLSFLIPVWKLGRFNICNCYGLFTPQKLKSSKIVKIQDMQPVSFLKPMHVCAEVYGG